MLQFRSQGPKPLAIYDLGPNLTLIQMGHSQQRALGWQQEHKEGRQNGKLPRSRTAVSASPSPVPGSLEWVFQSDNGPNDRIWWGIKSPSKTRSLFHLCHSAICFYLPYLFHDNFQRSGLIQIKCGARLKGLKIHLKLNLWFCQSSRNKTVAKERFLNGPICHNLEQASLKFSPE